MRVLFVAGLLFWASLATLLPVLPLYVQSMGANSQTVGIVVGSFAIGLLASRPALARMADRRGRKLVLLIGMVTVAIAPIGYIATQSIPLLIVVRAFHGLSIAAFALAYSALIVDLSPPQRRGELIGYMSLVNPIGMGLGPAIGGFMQSWVGYTPTFWTAAALGIVGLFFTVQVQDVYLPTHATAATGAIAASGTGSEQFWLKLLQPHIRTPALVLLLVGVAFGTLTTFVPLLVVEVGVNLNVGLIYSAAAIASFGIRLLVGRASDYYGRGLFITGSLVLYALSMAVLWQASSTAGFLVAGLLEGCGSGILIPMMAVLMADRSQPHERGLTFSLCMVGFDLGIALAGPFFGAIAIQLNYQTIFGLASLLSWLGLLVFLVFSGKNIPQSLRFALGKGKDIYAVEPATQTYK